LKFLFDLHTHTVASGHAFSTLKENVEEAAKKGLKVLGISDHASAMPGSASPIYFSNFKAVKSEILGVRVFMGVEANIMDLEGRLDMEEEALNKMDYVIASLHVPCIKAGTARENTDGLIRVMKNPYVKIIGHPDDDRYPLEYDRLAQAAKEEGVALEINNSSFSARSGRQNADKNAPVLLEKCEKYGTSVIAGSDAHIFYDVGSLEYSENMILKSGIPEKQVLNLRLDGLAQVLNLERKETAEKYEQLLQNCR
jgi:putative hydrolase